MTVDNAIYQYKKIVRSLNEIRDLLRTTLINVGVDITGQPSLNTLMSKINPIDINSVVNQKLSNIPIDSTQHFNSIQDIYDYFYTDIDKNIKKNDVISINFKLTNNSGNPISGQTVYLYKTSDVVVGSNKLKINNIYKIDYVLSQANLLLIRKFLFYYEYLKYQLKNMGIPQHEIKQAKTIKDLILLIKKIERIKKVYVSSESDTLYVNEDTDIEINVVDDTGNIIEDGIINIYLGTQAIGTPYKTYQINNEYLIKVDSPGQYVFTIEYVNIRLDGTYIKEYQPTVPITIVLNAIYETLEGTLIAQNMNVKSKYYWANQTEIAGFINDYWNLNIQITNTKGESINRIIPFSIYVEDTDHLLTSGLTNTQGLATISNINIPYYSSDFIDFKENSISNFINIEQNNEISTLILNSNKNFTYNGDINPPTLVAKLPIAKKNTNIKFYINYYDDDLLDNLSFIRKPIFVDNTIKYQRVNYTGENRINELNGCITDIRFIDNELRYTIFYTKQNTKLKNINNLTEKLKHLITEIFYNNDILDYETIDISKYDYTKDVSKNHINLILKTKLQQEEYPNIEILTPINIYHTPISVNNNYLELYKTDPNIPTSIPITFHDKYTGEEIDYLDDVYYIGIDNKYNLVNSTFYNYSMNLNNLPYGQNIFSIVLSYKPLDLDFNIEQNIIEQNKNIIIGNVIMIDNNNNPIMGQTVQFYKIDDQSLDIVFVMQMTIMMLSNFILPSKILYFLNDTPDIYYKPKGITTSAQIKINNINYNTNSNGLIQSVKDNKDIGIHNLILKAASDGLTEERTFSYEIKKPFKIEQKTYNRTYSATYRITIYDNEHIDWNTAIPQQYITIKNNENNINYTYTSIQSETELIYDVYVTINNALGTNVLTVNINEYSESVSFKLYSELFELISNTEYTLGSNNIFKIKCNDNDINVINIYGNGIEQKTVTPSIVNNEKIFTIYCTITQAAPNGTTLYMTDNQGTTETTTIYIPKANINSDYSMNQAEYIYGDNPIAIWNIDSTPTSENITIIFNNGINDKTQVKGIGTQKQYTYNNLKNITGTHTTSITFVGNNNYNGFVKEVTYTILPNELFISNISLNNNGDLILNMISRSNISNTNLVNNINLDSNQDLIITKKNIMSNSNITNVIKNININNNNDLIFEIEDTNYNITTIINKNIVANNNQIELQFVMKNQNNSIVPNAIIKIYEV